MRRRSARAALALTSMLTVVSCSSEQPAPEPAPAVSNFDTAATQGALDALVDAGSPAAVIEIRRGADTWSSASGQVEYQGDEAAAADDPVRIASITKSMVAAVVLQLVDEGKLTLDQNVDDILPGLLPKAVTIRQLLDHTSGLPNYLDDLVPPDAPGLAQAADDRYTDEQLVADALAQPWPLEPGAQFSYSNTNYVVLGEIVEKLDGRSVAESLNTRIFEPTGMESTEYPTDGEMPDGSLHGYILGDGSYTDVTQFDPSIWSSSAAVVSTVGDLNTFFRALYDGTLVPQPLVQQMQVLTPSGYGLGLLVGGDACNPGAAELVWGQRGNGFGYRTLAFSSPDGDRQVSVAWTASAIDPATDALEQAASSALIAGLTATCP